METQESFAAYVGARLAMLYRLAVLLVGEADAADLTQNALVRALRSWDRVQEVAHPDAYVKRILVNTMLSEKAGLRLRERVPAGRVEAAVPSPEHAVVDRDELWSRISALPPRQRAVVVLRYYEDLSEAEIARVLGCAPGTVKAHASAALRTLRSSIDRPGGVNGGGDD